jgi:outer membrane protein
MLLCAAMMTAAGRAQVSTTMTLAQAQEIALREHPHIASAALSAQASASVVKEARSAYYPTVSGNVTGVGAEPNATLSSGAVQTSSLYNRVASGVVANQLIADFGRTSQLVASARLRDQAQNQNIAFARAQVLLEVRRAYYDALSSEAVLKVAQATVDLRRLTLRQVNALAQSSLRSTLDVSFAQVNVSEAELALVRARNDARASHARLSAALGYQQDRPFTLADEPLPEALPAESGALIAEALQDRPDLQRVRLNQDSLVRLADAEKRLRNPTIVAAALAGVAPGRDDKIRETYSAAGVNINIPVFNGGLFSARRAEAESRAAAAAKDVDDLIVQVSRDVQLAWLDANDAFERLDVTARLVTQANESLRLAQARYDSGLGSIVELNQAELNQTSAQITAAAAKYDYLSRRAALDYATGALR